MAKKVKQPQEAGVTPPRNWRQIIWAFVVGRPPSNWAQIISVLVATAAVAGISWQVDNNNRNAQRSAARRVYMSYSEAALKYPEFDEPNLAEIKKNPLKFVQYQEYVAHMLFAYDEVLAVDDVPAWRKTFEHDLEFHKAFLCEEISQRFNEVFFPKMQGLLNDFKRNSCSPKTSRARTHKRAAISGLMPA